MNILNSIKEFNTEYPMGRRWTHTLDEAKQAYLDSADEYAAALEIAGSWIQWQKMIKVAKFSKIVVEWREEKKLKDKSELLAMYWKRARKGDTTAQRTLFDYNFKETKKLVGRPNKIKEKDDKSDIIKEASKNLRLAINNERSNTIKSA